MLDLITPPITPEKLAKMTALGLETGTKVIGKALKDFAEGLGTVAHGGF
jgi:hypothetical protein